RAALANRSHTAANVQPAILLEYFKQIVGVGNLARDDFFFSLLIRDRECNLHRLIGRILLGEVNEFHVEGFRFLRLYWHLIPPVILNLQQILGTIQSTLKQKAEHTENN